MNKITEYTEILSNYWKPDLDEFKRFNIKQLRKEPKTEKQEDQLESFWDHFSIQLLAILKFWKTKEVSWINSITSPENQSHISEEMNAIMMANWLKTEDENWYKINIKL